MDWDEVRRRLRDRPPEVATDEVRFRAAVALVLRDRETGPEVLFIRRAEHPQDPWSGQIAFPGGRREDHDPDLRATAVRETAEETGIDLAAAGEFLAPLDEVRAMARMRPMNLVIAPFAFRLRHEVEPVPSSEVESIHWLPLTVLLSGAHRASHPYTHQGTALLFPCHRVGDLVIWGLTYRMFEAFAARLGFP